MERLEWENDGYFDYNYDYMTEWILSEHLECMYYEGFFEHSFEEIESSDFVINTHEIKFSPLICSP